MINKNFAMMVLQMVSHTAAEACPPPCVNTTYKLHLFGHWRGKKTSKPYTIRAGRCPQLTAFFTSAPILASSVAVSSFSAKAVGHMAPSSRPPFFAAFVVVLRPLEGKG
jgi:hypothetical protein